MGKRLLALISKEFIQIRRDKRTLAMMLVVPVLWLTMFGYAATFDIKHIPVDVLNQGQSDLAARLVETVQADESFKVNPAVASRSDMFRRLREGQTSLGLIIPADFGKLTAADQEPAQVEVLVDGSDFFSAQAGLRAFSPILQKMAAELAAEQARGVQAKVKAGLTAQAEAIGKLQQQLAQQAQVIAQLQAKVSPAAPGAAKPSTATPATPPPGAAIPTIDLPTRKLPISVPKVDILFNPELRSANVMIPGLTGMVILFITSMMTALGIVREKEHGTLEQIVVSPITSFELMIGKLVPYTLIGLFDFALVMAAGIFVFDVPFAGNMSLFVGFALLFLLSTLGLGLLVSTMAQNQQQAIQMSMFMVFPQFLVSGLIFPISAMPVVIRYLAYLFPLTYFMPLARGMFLKGLGLDVLYLPATLLGIYGVAMIAFASLRFRKRLG